jgi:outer membrane receptor protein involved in Fe transport
MVMSLKGQLLKTNGGRIVKLTAGKVTHIWPALISLLLFLCLAPGALAQGLSGSTLRGVVKDSSGGLVPNATVRLISSRSGGEREVKSNDEGSYVFTGVDPGLYTLRVEAPGFKSHLQTEFTLSPSDTRNLDVALEVGAPSETVTVTGDATPIKTDTGERSDTLTAKQLDNLSIIGRSSLELLRILPGVVAPDPNDLEFNSFGGGSNANANYTVNGIRGVNNNVSIDGSRVIDIGSNNGTIITANNDMVQEVTVKTSNYAAEYGSSTVQVFATTKAGGKDFHGEVYDYIRPKGLQASDRSNTIAGAKQPNTSFKYPGGNLGGPVYLPRFGEGGKPYWENKNKLFFFVGLEFQRQIRDPGTKLGTVPTLAERNGDFSQSQSSRAGNRFCPATTAWNADCATPVAGGNFTPFRSPLGAALLNLFPLPNFTGTGPNISRNYASSVIAPENRTDLKMRFDYKVSNNTSVYLRLARESESDDGPYGIWWGPSTFELPSHLIGTNLGRSAAANITSVLSPTMTNELVVSASKLKLNYDFADPSKVSKSALGLANLQLPWGDRAVTPYAPLGLISWDVNAHLWEPGGIPLFAFNDSESLSETLSKVSGNHTLKFGGLIERAGKFQNLQGTTEGQIEYEGGGNNHGGGSAVFTSGNAFANLYSGVINGIDQTTNVPNGKFKFWNFEAFAQDSWKFRSNITLELGARISYYTNNAEQTGLGVAFSIKDYQRGAGAFLNNDPTKPNGILTEKSGKLPKGIFAKNPPVLFGPRLNVAWDVFKDGGTVLRGGAGVFYNRVQGNYQYGVLTAPPNLLSLHADSWGNGQRPITLDNLAQYNPITNPGTLSRPAIYTQDPNPDTNIIPQVVTTSLSVARRLPFQNVLEVAYVGTFGRHLPQSYSFNFVYPHTSGTLGNANLANPLHRAALGQNINFLNAQLLPFPDWGSVKYNEFIGTSNYHSMQLTLNRQLGKSLQYFLTYTFSKALGTAAVNESDGDASIDPLNGRDSYGILPYDRTHIFNLSYNYNFPKLARGSLDKRFMRGVLDGWQMSGITTYQSGRPIRIKFGGNAQSTSARFAYLGHTVTAGGNTGQATGLAPVISRNPVTGNTTLGAAYLDIAAISVPAFGTNGPAQSPFYIRAPTTNNYDVTFFKNFKISESKKFQFRVGFFNVFNEAFPNPDAGDFGNLTINTLNTINPATGQCFYLPADTPNGQATVGANTVCDPTKGFIIDPASAASFGKVISKHGHRRTELAFKFYF